MVPDPQADGGPGLHSLLCGGRPAPLAPGVGHNPGMDRYERINALHRLLKSARYPVTVMRLQEELGCSRATVYRDLAFLRDALMAQNMTGKNGRTVENELLEFINEHIGSEEKVLLAGNSIHQDRRFITNEWPRLDERLHYRMLDVSAWKVVFEGKYKKKFAKPEAHRAIEDIQGSIEELKYYLKKIK